MSDGAPFNEDLDVKERARKDNKLAQAIALVEGEFDGVIILGTYQNERGDTATLFKSDGNWHAVNGMADYLLVRRRREMQIEADERLRNRSDDE